jgi:hypothetical protein
MSRGIGRPLSIVVRLVRRVVLVVVVQVHTTKQAQNSPTDRNSAAARLETDDW